MPGVALGRAAAPAGERSAWLYGKLPARGDFLTRGFEPAARAVLDLWLQALLAATADQLGPGWRDSYLTAPIWRFLTPAHAITADALCGVLLASVDRVGRLFPLVIAAPQRSATLADFIAAQDWLERLETLGLAMLDDAFDAAGLDQALHAAGAPERDRAQHPARAAILRRRGAVALALPPETALTAERLAALDQTDGAPASVWLNPATAAAAGLLLAVPGLPPPELCATLIDGDATRWPGERA